MLTVPYQPQDAKLPLWAQLWPVTSPSPKGAERLRGRTAWLNLRYVPWIPRLTGVAGLFLASRKGVTLSPFCVPDSLLGEFVCGHDVGLCIGDLIYVG